MSISANIQGVSDKIQVEIEAHEADPAAPAPVTEDLHTKAMAAILGGGENPAWMEYMMLFADTAQELAHLMPDGTPLDEKRAYLVANGKCMMGTTTGLIDNVTTTLDI